MLISAVVLLAASISITLVQGQEPTFRSGTRIVPVITTVTDAQGRLVPGLDQEEFTILDNGKPQPITFFQNDVQPFTVVVMMDFSGSMTANLERLKAAAEQFVLRMLPADKGQVGAFSDKIQFSGTFTNKRDDLILRAQGPAVRQSNAPLGRRQRKHRHADGRRGAQGGPGVYRR